MTSTTVDWTNFVYGLSDILQGSLTSIEILPGGLLEWELMQLPPGSPKPSPEFPFVLVEGNLGIPRKILYAIYTAATSLQSHNSGSKEAIASSSVIILVNPAYQTALNRRKELILDGFLNPEKELILTELMVRGSPECAKQSMMWDHRRWCFQQVYGKLGRVTARPFLQCWAGSEEIYLFPNMGPNAIRHELDVAHHTCETYPRNYHSWTHLHFLMDVCYASMYLSDDFDSHRKFLGVIIEECAHLRRWVEQHVSDYSAMHQLCQLQRLLDHLIALDVVLEDSIKSLTSSSLVDHAVSLLVAFPSHEALWMFLRLALDNLSDENREKFLKELVQKKLPVSRFRQRLLDWSEKERGWRKKGRIW